MQTQGSVLSFPSDQTSSIRLTCPKHQNKARTARQTAKNQPSWSAAILSRSADNPSTCSLFNTELMRFFFFFLKDDLWSVATLIHHPHIHFEPTLNKWDHYWEERLTASKWCFPSWENVLSNLLLVKETNKSLKRLWWQITFNRSYQDLTEMCCFNLAKHKTQPPLRSHVFTVVPPEFYILITLCYKSFD